MSGLEQIPWFYDACCAVGERMGFRRWREGIVRRARGRTLAVGCGTGRNLPALAARVPVVGMDPARAPLLRARRRAPDVPLVQAVAEALPFRDAAFDTVLSSLVFCSVADPRGALGEVRRVLRRDGVLAMLEHVRGTNRWRAAFQDFVTPVWSRVSGGCHPNRETERTVDAAGFDIDAADREARGVMRCFVARPR